MAETFWGVWLHAVRPPSELAVLAEAAEALGAAALLVADEGTDRDVFVTLAALTNRTRRVLLFGAVTNPHSRHPVAAAAAFATLEELAPGRIVAGFGAGGGRVFGPLGLAPRRPATALQECVDVAQALWRGETVDHEGEFSVRGARLEWSPRELPVAMAGRGPRVERLAAERADWVLLAGRAVSTVPGLVARLREAGRAARGRPPKIAWNPVAAWTDAMREELRAHLAYMAPDMPSSDRMALGLSDDDVAQLRSRLVCGDTGSASRMIGTDVLTRYAIVGNRSHVVARLAAVRKEVRPELLVFDAQDYSLRFLEDLAAVASDAGASDFHSMESLHGLDSHD